MLVNKGREVRSRKAKWDWLKTLFPFVPSHGRPVQCGRHRPSRRGAYGGNARSGECRVVRDARWVPCAGWRHHGVGSDDGRWSQSSSPTTGRTTTSTDWLLTSRHAAGRQRRAQGGRRTETGQPWHRSTVCHPCLAWQECVPCMCSPQETKVQLKTFIHSLSTRCSALLHSLLQPQSRRRRRLLCKH